jgi:hypothetical protein
MTNPIDIQQRNQIHEIAGISMSKYAQNNTPKIGISE